MIKLVVTDLDGTLAKVGSSSLNSEYYEAIRELKKLGIVFAVASGRQPDSIMNVFKPVLEDIYIISSNGAATYYNSKCLYSYDIDLGIIKDFTPKLRRLPNSYMLLTGDTGIYFDDSPKAFIDFVMGYGFSLDKFISYENLPHINKICIFNNIDNPHPALVYKGKYDNLTTYIAGDGWVDFVDKRASKGLAVSMIQQELSISKEETIVFGDQQNDISMFEMANFSYAVDNASKEVLDAAGGIIPGYKEDGVLKIWNSIISNKGEYFG